MAYLVGWKLNGTIPIQQYLLPHLVSMKVRLHYDKPNRSIMGQARNLETNQVRTYLMVNMQTANPPVQREAGLIITEKLPPLYPRSRAYKPLLHRQLQKAARTHEGDHRQSMRIEVLRMHWRILLTAASLFGKGSSGYYIVEAKKSAPHLS